MNHVKFIGLVLRNSEWNCRGLETTTSTTMLIRRTGHLNLLGHVWFGDYNIYNPFAHLSGRQECTSRLWGPSFSTSPSVHACGRCYQTPSSVSDSVSSRSRSHVATLLHLQMFDSARKRPSWPLRPSRTSAYASPQAFPTSFPLSSILLLGNTILLLCVCAREFSTNSFLL